MSTQPVSDFRLSRGALLAGFLAGWVAVLVLGVPPVAAGVLTAVLVFLGQLRTIFAEA